ncbi:hypothetical protein WJX74_009273 [Apatococcus lobatus]|uniref:Uncharacterized protein n=2 Tax=Apatococcus TaxID=904362 RepID=A0AAW1RHQ8_9CHLO
MLSDPVVFFAHRSKHPSTELPVLFERVKPSLDLKSEPPVATESNHSAFQDRTMTTQNADNMEVETAPATVVSVGPYSD